MSDISIEGSAAKPYRENPPTHFVEVHWGGGKAVKWNFAQYLYAGPLTAVPNSPAGVLSMWVKFYPEALNESGQTTIFGSGWHELLLAVTGGVATAISPGVNKVSSLQFEFDDAATFDTENRYAFMLDGEIALSTTGRWYHIYAEWDTGAGSFVLKVNGRSAASLIATGEPFGAGGPPFDVAWAATVDNSGDPNVNQFFQNFGSFEPPVRHSLAEFWLDVKRPAGDPDAPPSGTPAPGVDKFVDTATGKPKSLGTNGEIPTGRTPAFYFRRSGAPETFVINRGYGGDFTFARLASDFTSSDIANPALDPPLHEPEEPHFTPIPAPPLAAAA
jgi:hypothetical protein